MEWPDSLEIHIDSLAQGGAGVGRYEDRPVFVEGALPGEQVQVQLRERRAAWARGEVVQLLSEPAPERANPPCPVYNTCGGCDWQHLAIPAQRAAKQQILHEQLTFVGQLEAPTTRPTVAQAAWNYRSTARFHVQGKQIGFYTAGGRKIVSFTACPLLDAHLNQALQTIRAKLPLPGLKEVSVRVSQTNQHVHVLLHGRSSSDWNTWAKALHQALPAIKGVSFDTRKGWKMLTGTPYLFEQFDGVNLQISPTSFFQANVEQAQAVLATIRNELDWTTINTLLDGFCGVGTFILPLSKHVQQAWGIEEHPAAIRDAQASTAANKITNVQFHSGRMEEVLPTLDIRPDLVILDPPRRGCEPPTLQALIERQTPYIVYVSCHPGTLSRDIRALTNNGYQQRWSQPFDFFPQTSHLESVTILERSKA